MSTVIERLRIDGCDEFSVSKAFIKMEGAGYVRKKYTPTSEVSHLEIYQYQSPAGEKITVVYDTVAKILTIDAPAEQLTALRPILPEGVQKPAKQVAAQQTNQAAVTGQPKQPAKQKQTVRQSQTPKAVKSKPEKQPQKKVPDSGEGKTKKQTRRKPEKPAVETETLKGITRKRLDWALKDMKSSDGIKVTAHTGNASWTLTDADKNTAELRMEGTSVCMTGKKSPLIKLVRDRLTSKCDMKLLRKYLSVSLRYLSEASRIDLSNGLTDFANISRLSDYSVLLITPYRALEKLIYDLQQAEGINVKMIGQAYEKDEDGKYMLKKGYLKRINSVVYSEVMTSLYTEYYATRNFYTHSENAADSRSRGISDKAEAQKILGKLLSVIEYNCKKLSEIGFAIAED